MEDTNLLLNLTLSNHHHFPAAGEPSDNSLDVGPSLTLSLLSNHRQQSLESAKREREIGVSSTDDDDEEAETTTRVSSSKVSDEDDGGGGGNRKKLRLTRDQSALLEENFKHHSTLSPKQKQDLARQLKLRRRQVEVWFQNRRARSKLKQTEVDCQLLKKCYQSLTDENSKLKKEVHQLKAAAAVETAPFYSMTVTLCPSCGTKGGGGFTDPSSSAAC